MRIDFLETFLEVVSAGSFLEAAKRLRITQGTVSNQIAALEDYFGVRLFVRTREGVQLTREGEILYKRAREIIDLMKTTKNELVSSSEKLKGVIKIAASTIPGEHIMPAIAGSFKETHPDVDIEIDVSDTGTSLKKLIEGRVDFAAVGSLMDSQDMLETKVIYRENLVVITSVNHELSKKKSIRLQEILNYPFISRQPSSGTRNEINKIFQEQNINPNKLNIKLELGSTGAVITAVSENIGISIVSSIAAEKAKTAGLIHILKIENARNWRNLYLVRLKKPKHPELLERFWESIKEHTAAIQIKH
ncbi:MAG: selenium metabolism-associated LysR family transcriptional regulator [Candidatus Jordarchaeaceae archaeon]